MKKKNNFGTKLAFYSNKLGELVILNMLTLAFCIPVVTVATSLSAMHYVLIRIYRDEEQGVFKHFWKFFHENFLQGILISIIYLVLYVGQAWFYWLMLADFIKADTLLIIAVVIISVLTVTSFQWVCIFFSRYEDKTGRIIKNSFRMILGKPLTSIMLGLLSLLPFIGIMLWIYILPIVVFLGLSLTGMAQTLLYKKVFSALEEKKDAESNNDNETGKDQG